MSRMGIELTRRVSLVSRNLDFENWCKLKDHNVFH